MTRRSVPWPVLLLLFGPAVRAADPVLEVDAPDLARRADLIGKEMTVDGRVAYFQIHEGIFDEVYLKKTPTVFRLPAELRTRQAPEAATVRVRGTLRKEAGGLVFDVSSLRLLPTDAERLRQGLALLSPEDAEDRLAWARWARHRGEEYGEPALVERARALDAEAIRIESTRPGSGRPEATLRLARRARDLHADEPEPSAIAHRGVRGRLEEARSPADLAALVSEVESFFPASVRPVSPDPNGLSDWLGPYQNDPAASYRRMPAELRPAVDRRLLADVLQRWLERQAAQGPDATLALADQARSRLPDRPDVASKLEAAGLARQTDDEHLKSLRSDELEPWIRRFQARNEPERVVDLKRRWLNIRAAGGCGRPTPRPGSPSPTST